MNHCCQALVCSGFRLRFAAVKAALAALIGSLYALTIYASRAGLLSTTSGNTHLAA
jgi:hypothetical protein